MDGKEKLMAEAMDQSRLQNKEDLIYTVMNEYGERLIRLAFTYVKDWGDAEDIVQEVFTTCYTKLDTFRGDGSIKSWLYRITVNKCKDHLKSWFSRNIWFSNTFEKMLPDQDKTPELKLIVKSDNQELAEKILELNVKYREVIILFYQEEMSIQEISSLLQMNESTVKSRLHRARHLLKKSLSDPNE